MGKNKNFACIHKNKQGTISSFILMLMLTLCVSTSSASTPHLYHYTSKYFSCAKVEPAKDSLGNVIKDKRLYYWSDWVKDSVEISVDIKKGLVIVNTEEPQVYHIVDYEKSWKDDSENGKALQMITVDQDGDQGICRLRIDAYNHKQIYFEFSNIIWGYSGLKDADSQQTLK